MRKMAHPLTSTRQLTRLPFTLVHLLGSTLVRSFDARAGVVPLLPLPVVQLGLCEKDQKVILAPPASLLHGTFIGSRRLLRGAAAGSKPLFTLSRLSLPFPSGPRLGVGASV